MNPVYTLLYNMPTNKTYCILNHPQHDIDTHILCVYHIENTFIMYHRLQ